MLNCLFKSSNYKMCYPLKRLRRKQGFSLLEILVVIVIVGIIGVSVISLQASTWKRTTQSNRLLVAGQVIEKQIEYIRMNVAEDPKANFPPKDGTTSENNIALSWKFSSVNRLKGSKVALTNVRQCDLTATWGKSKGDTLKITTYISKFF